MEKACGKKRHAARRQQSRPTRAESRTPGASRGSSLTARRGGPRLRGHAREARSTRSSRCCIRDECKLETRDPVADIADAGGAILHGGHASDPEFVVERSQIEGSRSLPRICCEIRPRRLFMLTETLAPHVSARTRAKGRPLLPLGRGHRRRRRRVDGPRARAGHTRLPCRAGARPEPVHRLLRVPVLRGPRGDLQAHLGRVAGGRTPGTSCRGRPGGSRRDPGARVPAVGARRIRRTGRVVLDVADEAAAQPRSRRRGRASSASSSRT